MRGRVYRSSVTIRTTPALAGIARHSPSLPQIRLDFDEKGSAETRYNCKRDGESCRWGGYSDSNLVGASNVEMKQIRARYDHPSSLSSTAGHTIASLINGSHIILVEERKRALSYLV